MPRLGERRCAAPAPPQPALHHATPPPQVLGLVEGGDASAELLMDVPDGFGRLLVHGLCEFHGLLVRSAGP